MELIDRLRSSRAATRPSSDYAVTVSRTTPGYGMLYWPWNGRYRCLYVLYFLDSGRSVMCRSENGIR